jgi:mannose-6-phosphate isomerase-like protein (cupin superfamily)
VPVIGLEDLPTTRPGGITRIVEGAEHDVHPSAEVFLVQQGLARFTMGIEMTDVAEGRIVMVPAGVTHAFANLGSGRLRQISLHPSPKVMQTRLDEGASTQSAPVAAHAAQMQRGRSAL